MAVLAVATAHCRTRATLGVNSRVFHRLPERLAASRAMHFRI